MPPDIDKLEARRDVDGLIRALKNEEDRDVRRSAAKALGRIGGARAVEPLIEALRVKGWVQEAAVDALGNIGDARAAEPLIAYLMINGGGFASEVDRIYEAIAKIGAPAVAPLIAALRVQDRAPVRAEPGRPAQVAAVLTFEGQKEDAYKRRYAARALGRIGDARAFDPLVATLRSDPDAFVRWAAAAALGDLGDPRATAALTDCIETDRTIARDAAADALSRLRAS